MPFRDETLQTRYKVVIMYLEVESQLPIDGQSVNTVPAWPFNANPPKSKT